MMTDGKPDFEECELIEACRLVFGGAVEISSRFLAYLQPSGLKSAFRERAKQVHPDLHGAKSGRRFQELKAAHDLLMVYLEHRDRAPKPQGPRYYQGPVPRGALQFGVYLFYRGAISAEQLFEAIRWQRRQRPLLGRLAIERGWLTDQEARSALINRDVGGLFGEKCVRLGLMTEEQVRKLVYLQRSRQKRIGQFFVESQILTRSGIDSFLRDCHLHNVRFKNGV